MDRHLVTDENIEDMMETASYDITYWSREPTYAEKFSCGDDIPFVVVDAERNVLYRLTYEKIRDAYFRCLDLDQRFFNSAIHGYFIDSWRNRSERTGIDTGYIDGDAADCLVQVACFGDVIYG